MNTPENGVSTLPLAPGAACRRMLTFALSLDEVIVTTFADGKQETLPIWILSQLVRPRNQPVANVVAIFVIAVTVIPILLAHCLTQDTSEVAGLESGCADDINPTGYRAVAQFGSARDAFPGNPLLVSRISRGLRPPNPHQPGYAIALLLVTIPIDITHTTVIKYPTL
jgi:hypothetical protein